MTLIACAAVLLGFALLAASAFLGLVRSGAAFPAAAAGVALIVGGITLLVWLSRERS